MSQQINLYNPILRKQRRVFSAVAIVQAVGFVLAVVAGSYFYLAQQSALFEVRAIESGARLKSELERLKLLTPGGAPEDKAKALDERRKRLEASLAEYTSALGALDSGRLGSATGYSQQLQALARLSSEGLWLTQIRFAEGGALSLAGRASRAELVAGYLERLRAEPALGASGFSSLEISRQQAAAAPGARAVSFVEFLLSSDEAKEAK